MILKTQNSFDKILGNKNYYAKVTLKRFHLNDHNVGLHPQTQRLELHTKYTDTTISPAPVLTFAPSALRNTSFHHLHHI